MLYRIVEKEAFKIIGKCKRVTCVNDKNDSNYKFEVWVPIIKK